jgi:hypothetical protein
MRIIQPLRWPYQHPYPTSTYPNSPLKTQTIQNTAPGPKQMIGNFRRGAALSSIQPKKQHPYLGPQLSDRERSPRSGSLLYYNKQHKNNNSALGYNQTIENVRHRTTLSHSILIKIKKYFSFSLKT